MFGAASIWSDRALPLQTCSPIHRLDSRWDCSVKRRLTRGRHGHQFSACAGARQDDSVHFVFRDLGHFPRIAQRAFDVFDVRPLGLIRGQIKHRGKSRAHLAEGVQSAMSSFGQVRGFLWPEQPFDEAVKFLPTHQGQGDKPFTGRFSLDYREAEGLASVLMTCESVPQAHDQRADQFICRVNRLELR
jgi:hypothetical protein